MAIAMNEERTILTFDRDYGELIFRHNNKPEKGAIYLRLNEYEPEQPGLIIEEIDLTQTLTAADKNGLRQRLYCSTRV